MEPENELRPEVAAALRRLDDLVRAFEQHPEPAVQEDAVELLQCVDVVHRAGLRRLAELLAAAGLLPCALADPQARLLFDLYDLGEGGERARVEAILDTVRPDVEAHGVQLELAEATAGVVRVRLRRRLSGAGQGCMDSMGTLRHVVEQALYEGLADFVHVEVLETTPDLPTGFVPLAGVKRLERPRPGAASKHQEASR